MLAFAFATLLAACSGGSGQKDSGGDSGGDDVVDPRTLVEVATVVVSGVGDHLISSAAVESEAQAFVIPETQGMVTAVYAEEGDAVTKGQLLAIVASPQLDAAYQRASAEVEHARADLEAAERLYSQGAVARSERDTAKRLFDGASTALQEASSTRGFTRLEAPIPGTVASRGVRYGEVTSPPTAAFTIVDLDKLRVVVHLPERDVHRVHNALSASLQSAYDGGAVTTGRVSRIAPVVDPTTGTVRVTVALDPGQTLLRPGQFVSVRIEVDRHEGVLTAPRRALVYEEGKAYVYVVTEGKPADADKKKGDSKKGDGKGNKSAKKGGFHFTFPWDKEDDEEKEPDIPGPWRTAKRALVTVGYEDGETAEITTGVADGDVVVTVGNQALRDGARVRLPTDPTLGEKDEQPPTPPSSAPATGAAGG